MSGSGRKVSIPSFFLAGVSATVRLSRDSVFPQVPRGRRLSSCKPRPEPRQKRKPRHRHWPPRACIGKAKLGRETRPDTRERLGTPGLSLFEGQARRLGKSPSLTAADLHTDIAEHSV